MAKKKAHWFVISQDSGEIHEYPTQAIAEARALIMAKDDDADFTYYVVKSVKSIASERLTRTVVESHS